MPLKKFAISVLAALTLCLCGCSISGTEKAPEAAGEFKFSVLKIGQADAIIMQTENHCVIIDCGEKDDGKEVKKYLADNGIENVDYLFITHFDKDHVGGAAKVINSVNIGEVVTPDYEGTNDEYQSYLDALEEHSLTPVLLDENMTFTLDDVLFEVYPPQEKSYAEDDNDFSLVISVTHGENRFLFTGDAEKTRLKEIMRQVKGEYDFLKVPHHGRYNKYSSVFFKAVTPAYSVITDSEKNPAESETAAALESTGSSVYYTRNGTVHVQSDGKQITVTQ
ncbi:MAG: MBL fold metallo-hydrolase [Oscillospiraceae bacterium]|nr:MBL fold metallo-hydrolase [Oscillospiraceae bacterium]